MNIIQKVTRGDDLRPSRLHTEAGEIVGLGTLMGLIPSGLTWLRYRITGEYICQPWWVWGAIRFVGRHLRPVDRVLELGSGYSTVWLAERCSQVTSIEESPHWKEKVEMEVAKRGLANVNIVTGASKDLFAGFLESGEWTVIAIDDPSDRAAIFKHLLVSCVRPRIVIYDNTDRASDRAVTNKPIEGYERKTFCGFGPQTVHPWQTTVFVRLD